MEKSYQSSPLGQEISCVIGNIKKEILLNTEALILELKKILEQEGFKILDIASHKFTPQGFTVFALLGESHATIHTYPEYSSCYFSIYSCRGPTDAEKTFEKIKNYLGSEKIIFLNKNLIPVKK
ncbi:MAG: S-adenosylmethionine decarboxylase [Nanoarchaeota archaeon]|nr:S-adenosylmethionine decarboxylase [Nanoarchaeota archaeon]